MGAKKVAVKYCGGCNPRYDRAALVSGVFEAFPELAPALLTDPDIWLALLVSGCSRRCVANAGLQGSKGNLAICPQDNIDKLKEAVNRLVAE